MTIETDIVIVGAGMVGAAAAGLLARCGFSVALVDAGSATTWDPALDIGLRVSALSPGSAAILEQAGAWRAIEAARSCAYRSMVIEDRSEAATLEFSAPRFGLERLGTIVENDLVQTALMDAVQVNPLVTLYRPAQPLEFKRRESKVEIDLDTGQSLVSSLLIGADGANSTVRQLTGAEEDIREYNQKGLVTVVRCSRRNPGMAWQRFLSGGPLAFLPLADGRSSIVWTLPAAEADRLVAAGEATFLACLADACQGWPGEPVECGLRGAFPLSMRLSDRYVAGPVVLLGDAAHQVHPLAGQGVNLGLADAAALVETLVENRRHNRALADAVALRRFETWRRSESGLMAQGIHLLGGVFGPDELALVRRIGMAAVGRSWFMGDAFVRRAAGVGPNSPRLSRGETLGALLSA